MESVSKLYVGNLSFHTTDDVLRKAFEECGQVVEVRVVVDRATGRSRGFAFVEMASEEEAQKAIDKMNNAEVDGRVLRVNLSEDRPSRPKGRGGSFGRPGRMDGGDRSGGGRFSGLRSDRSDFSDRRGRW